MRALLLAAGRGERMRPLTDTCPKPLLTLAGKPIIVHLIERLRDIGVTEMVINAAWLRERFEPTLGDGRSLGVQLRYSMEPTALETGGGIATALPLLCDGAPDAPFAVVSGDIYTEFDFSRLHEAARHLGGAPLDTCAHFVVVDNPPHHPAGDMALINGRIRRHGVRLNYGNIGVFHPAMFTGQPRGERWKLFPWAYDFVDANRVSGEHFSGVWENIGTPQQLAALDARLRR